MTSYSNRRSFFPAFIFLLFLCVTPSFSSDIEEVREDGIVAINMGHRTCTHRPDHPYTMQSPPEYLEQDPQFNWLKKTGYIYWVTGNVLASAKYVVGVAVTGVANVSLWDFVSEDAKGNLNIATAVLTLTTVVLQGLETGVNSKAKRYKKEAKGMIAQANLNAGLPVQPVTDSEDL